MSSRTAVAILLVVTLVAEVFMTPTATEWFFGAAYIAAFLLGGARYRTSGISQQRGTLRAGKLVLTLATVVIQGPYVALGCLVAWIIGVGLTYAAWPL